jgi:hypothetical protein
MLPTILLVASGCAAAIAAPTFVELVSFLGQYLYPLENILTDYLIGIMWAAVLGFSILLWPVPTHHKKILLLLWLVRCIVALGFMLLVEYRYRTGIDALRYISMAKEQTQFVWGDSGTERVTAFVWLHHQILPGDYHALKVTFAMLGMVASYIFYRTTTVFLQQENTRLFCLLGLFPSTLLWSSILGKDPIVLFGIALYVYGVVAQHQQKKAQYLILIVVGGSIAMMIRPWMGLILFAPLATFLMSRGQGISPVKAITLRILFIALFFGTTFISFNVFKEEFQIDSSEDVIERVTKIQTVYESSSSGSTMNLDMDLSNVQSSLLFLPLGIFNTLFRPLPGELLHIFGLLAGIENIFLLGLLFFAIKRIRLRDLWNPIVLWAVTLVFTWATLYALVSFNMGTTVRYKIQILLVLVCVLLYLGRKNHGTIHHAEMG